MGDAFYYLIRYPEADPFCPRSSAPIFNKSAITSQNIKGNDSSLMFLLILLSECNDGNWRCNAVPKEST